MFLIGDFSRLARVSCRLLRHYDDIGVLKPATVDRDNGYRYYSARQLPELNRILVLKELGFNLTEIAKLVDGRVSGAELRGMLTMRRSMIEQEVAAEVARLRSIEMRIKQVDEDGVSSLDDVMIRSEPARLLLGIRKTVPSFAAARSLLQTTVEEIRRRAARNALGNVMVVAHASDFEADALDLQMGCIVDGKFEGDFELSTGGRVLISELPAIERMATCVRIGLPEEAHLVTARIARMLEANGYALSGPGREVFLQPPRFDRMQDTVVEMQFAISAP